MVQKYRFCNAVNKGTGICSPYTFSKQPVTMSYCKAFQCTFYTVVVYANITILQISSQIYFLIKRIQNGITNKKRPVYRIFHRMQPFKHGIHNWTELFLAFLIFFFRCFIMNHLLDFLANPDPYIARYATVPFICSFVKFFQCCEIYIKTSSCMGKASAYYDTFSQTVIRLYPSQVRYLIWYHK